MRKSSGLQLEKDQVVNRNARKGANSFPAGMTVIVADVKVVGPRSGKLGDVERLGSRSGKAGLDDRAVEPFMAFRMAIGKTERAHVAVIHRYGIAPVELAGRTVPADYPGAAIVAGV